MKKCPVCQREYAEDVMFCPADGAGLMHVDTGARRSAEPVPSAGMPDDELSGQRLFGDYIIRKKLGEGGMGAVYLAVNERIDQRVAIKVLHGDAAQSDELVARFNREAKAIAKLTNPNVVRVFIFGRTDDGLIYLAMEFVEGRPLRDVIFEAKNLDELRAIHIMRQALHAVAEAHEIGIVHRDLKPDNIMLTSFRGVDDYVKVLDFGIAKVKEPGENQQKLTQAGVVYGTPEYLSPEQAQAKELDGRSDLYSLGVILYEMVTGHVPFQSNTAVAVLASHVYDEPKKPSEMAAHSVSPKMERIIMKAMAKDRTKRYQTAMEFLGDLEELEAELTGGQSTKTTVLDASKLAGVLAASRALQERRASGGPAPGPAPPSGQERSTEVVRPPVAAQAPQDNTRVTILYIVIAGLVILLALFAVALFVVSQR